jgi:alpha-glucuronidase
MWDFWDNLDGSVERGYACSMPKHNCSAVWPLTAATNQTTLLRVRDYARILVSVGINAVVLQNVNACAGKNGQALSSDSLHTQIIPVAKVFSSFGIVPLLSVCFASPIHVGNLSTADPKDEKVQAWWAKKSAELYSLEPMWGGFLVKADSEGNPGPMDYNCSQADGANLLASALLKGRAAVDPAAAHDGLGLVVWRAFVYGAKVSREDRARQAYDTFLPLDGHFASNVVVQVKNGPIDFQAREPVSSLFGRMRNTSLLLEVQATQEYLGQGVQMVGLAPQWQSYLDFDLKIDNNNNNNNISGSGGDGRSSGGSDGRSSTTLASLVAGTLPADAVHNQRWHGMAAVSNLGSATNWTGTAWAASNTYAFGRLAWDSTASAVTIMAEWNNLTWPQQPKVQAVTQQLLASSWLTYEMYSSPLGIGLQCGTGGKTKCPHGGRETDDPHYWMCPEQRYAYSHADKTGIGYDRSATGSNYSGQYSPAVAAMLDDVGRCPEELLLFFHHLPFNHTLKGSSDTLIQRILASHEEGVRRVSAYIQQWASLEGLVDSSRFAAVGAKLREQYVDACRFRDRECAYYAMLANVSWSPPKPPPTPPTPPTPAPPTPPPTPAVPNHFRKYARSFCHVNVTADRVFDHTETLEVCAQLCFEAHQRSTAGTGGYLCNCFDYHNTNECRHTISGSLRSSGSGDADAFMLVG